MKNKIIKLTALSIAATTLLNAGGYKIPEKTVNAVALSSANVANSKGADAAYYNPANMSFMQSGQSVDMSLTYIGLDATNFSGRGEVAGSWSPYVDIDAKSESFFVPAINYVSDKYKDFRFGFSTVVPGGLTKRWTQTPAADKAAEFSLKVVELNPTVAYTINKELSLALGLRALYSEGIVKSVSTASRDMEGNSWDYGYNLALSYKPARDIDMALTYRSNVDLTEEGNAKLYIGNAKVYDGGAAVSVPLPADLNLAFAYTLPSKTTVEFVYERTFWSSYKSLDFDYKSSIPLAIVESMDLPISKQWKDVSAYRMGLTQDMDKLTLMAGIVYDETPIPDDKVSFELPDSNSLSVSFGARYELDKSFDFGASMLYSMRDERSIYNNEIQGTFSDSNILLVSIGTGYKF